MFNNALSFNQDLDKWDVSSGVTFNKTFFNAKSFNKSIGNWVFSAPLWITAFSNMLDSSGLSVENYDSTLIAWERKMWQDSLYFGAVGLEFCNGDSARTALINNGWTFSGDSLNCSTVGITKDRIQNDLNIYPNPTNGQINIEIEDFKNITLFIYDINARKLKEVKLQKGKNQIDLSEYPDGLYFIRIGLYSKKVMLVH